jgi:hypothetical protein
MGLRLADDQGTAVGGDDGAVGEEEILGRAGDAAVRVHPDT